MKGVVIPAVLDVYIAAEMRLVVAADFKLQHAADLVKLTQHVGVEILEVLIELLVVVLKRHV